MADSPISGLPAATTLTGAEFFPLVQSGVTKRATVTALRTQGGDVIAQAGTPTQVRIGAVGPAGEPGSAYGAAGDSAVYRDVAAGGISFSVSGVERATIAALPGNNLAFGLTNLTAITSGTDNTAFGFEALKLVSDGNRNTGVGSQALETNSTGSDNTAIGANALTLNTGSTNTAVGANSLAANVSGTFNTAVGVRALQSATTTNNTAVGVDALFSQTSGSSNTAVGSGAGRAVTTASNNVYIGLQSGLSAVGANNVGVGAGSMTSTGGGNSSNSVGVGWKALSISDAAANTAVGAEALALNSSGFDNAALGQKAAANVNTATNNTAVGSEALVTAVPANATTSGSSNVAVGYRSGQSSATQRSNSIAIGSGARYDGDYAVALGFGALAGAGGAVAIGTDSSGVGASTTVINEIKLGTTAHTVAVAGKTKTAAGTGTSFAKVGGTIFDSYADVGNTGAAETDLVSNSIVANTLAINGQKLVASYGGMTTDNANTKRFRVYFAGTLILDSGAFADTGAASWQADVMIIRESATVVRCICKGTSFNTGAPVAALYTRITGLTLSGANILKITGTGTATNDIVLTQSRVEWLSEA